MLLSHTESRTNSQFMLSDYILDRVCACALIKRTSDSRPRKLFNRTYYYWLTTTNKLSRLVRKRTIPAERPPLVGEIRTIPQKGLFLGQSFVLCSSTLLSKPVKYSYLTMLPPRKVGIEASSPTDTPLSHLPTAIMSPFPHVSRLVMLLILLRRRSLWVRGHETYSAKDREGQASNCIISPPSIGLLSVSVV
jgi:hypothetical protein